MDETKALEELQREPEKESFPVSQESSEPLLESGSGLDVQILDEIKEEVSRRFQSAKDKRWAQLEKQYGILSDLQTKAEVEEPSLLGGVSAEKLLNNVNQLVEDMGLGEDPTVIALLQKEGPLEDLESYLGLMNQLTKIALGRGKGETASAGSVIQPSGGNAPMEDLEQVYDRQKRKLRPGDVNGLMALKLKFRGKGLKVY